MDSHEYMGVAKLDGFKRVVSHYSKLWKGGVYSLLEDKYSSIEGVVWKIKFLEMDILYMYEGVPVTYLPIALEAEMLKGNIKKGKKVVCESFKAVKLEKGVEVSEDYRDVIEGACEEHLIELN